MTAQSMRTWTTLAVGAALLGVGFAAGYLRYHPPTLTAAVAESLEAAQRHARELGNRLVSSRHLPEDAEPPAGEPLWKALTPWTDETLFERPPKTPGTVVVYVHGYNTSLPSAIANGNILAHELAALTASEPGSLLFYTFCWRGDFDRLEFERSERAATPAGAALADFLKRLSDDDLLAEHPRVVLLAHSLGARVALEAAKHLWQTAPRPWLGYLVLVQAAVPRGDLYVGTVQIFQSPRRAQEAGFVDPIKLQEYTHRGAYVDSLGVARHVIVTTSNGDGTLAGAYHADRHRWMNNAAFRYLPDLDEALGSPRGEWDAAPTHYREIPLTTALLSPARGHGGVYTHPELIRLLWQTMLDEESTARGAGVQPQAR